MYYDYLVVGAGLYGSVFAYELNKHGRSVLVLDKRQHIGGNIFTRRMDGIHVHEYGAHIFHTGDKNIWDYMNQFAEFNNYIHTPIANYNGQAFPLPFNMYTFNEMWGTITPEQAMLKIEEQKVPVVHPKNLEEYALSVVGRDIYEVLIKGYTEKQWGRPCTELPPFIIQRLPVRFTYDNRYFDQPYQGVPVNGYTKMIDKMLEGIDVVLGEDYLKNRGYWDSKADKVVYTGCIDEYFGYKFGHLEYRSVRFEHEVIDIKNYQGNAVVNYTDKDIPYTRIIEHRHFGSGRISPKTVISREYSSEWKVGGEPYYPINNIRNQRIYRWYKGEADKQDKVIFGGRLGEYKYYDMDRVVMAATDRVAQEVL